MDINKKNRTDLKLYFVKNAIPTESNFADLIDAMLNQKEDGIAKLAGNPLCIEATGDPGGLRKAINFYESFGDANPAWAVSLNPRVTPGDPNTAKPGFAISDATGANRLFIDKTTGNVGIGTLAPGRVLEVSAADSNTGIKITGTDSQRSWLVAVGVAAGDGQLAFYDFGAAAHRLTINKDGNVGIGTTKPTARLYVNNLDNSVGTVLATNGEGPAELRVRSYTTQPVNVSSFGIVHAFYNDERNGFINFWRGTSTNGGFLTFGTSGSERLRIDTSGNVGIGTTAPSHPFHVHTGEAVGLFESTGTQAYLRFATNEGLENRVEICNRPGGRLALWVAGGGDVFNIYKNGNIGIGNPNFIPQRNLHVEGWEIHSGGGVAGFSFANRDAPNKGAFVDAAPAGQRWVWYSVGSVARLWTNVNGDRISVNVLGQFSAAGGKGGYVMDQFINVLDDTLEEGDVVIIGSNHASMYYGTNDGIPIPEVDLTTRAMDTRVCGIVCTVHGNVEQSETAKSGRQARALTTEELLGGDHTKVQKGQVGWMVTLGAYAHCKVDADIAPIEVGDLLATSPTKGHAQKVNGGAKAVGAILGKALASLSSGKGKIPILVTLH